MESLVDDVAPAIMVLSFGLLMLTAGKLAQIQMAAVADSRDVSPEEGKRIYYAEYTDGDGAEFRWSEMKSYARKHGKLPLLRFWTRMVLVSLAGIAGSIALDMYMRT